MDYNNLFHVHTYRCGHAGNEADIDYVIKAVDLGADSIYFTDHAPFPGDIFGGRMEMSELEGYFISLSELKYKFDGIIDVNIGLEIEYIQKFTDYYKWIKDTYDMQLFLGQHICSHNGKYSFEYEDKKEEYKWMTDSVLEAVGTGLFAGVMHPERIYRNCKEWGEEQILSARSIWESTGTIPLEYNFESVQNDNIKIYHKGFWKEKSHDSIIYGLDAHNTEELYNGTMYFRGIKENS